MRCMEKKGMCKQAMNTIKDQLLLDDIKDGRGMQSIYATEEELEDLASDTYHMKNIIMDGIDSVINIIASLFIVNILLIGGATYIIISVLRG